MMNKERSFEVEFIRGELVGPARPLGLDDSATMVEMDNEGRFRAPENVRGTLYYRCGAGDVLQEIIHYRHETPAQRYGAGILHPLKDMQSAGVDDAGSAESSDESPDADESAEEEVPVEAVQMSVVNPDEPAQDVPATSDADAADSGIDAGDDDFEIDDADINQPSVMGISFCLEEGEGEFVLSLPPVKKFTWQLPEADPFPVNGRYEPCVVITPGNDGEQHKKAWRRIPATTMDTQERFRLSDLEANKAISRDLPLDGGMKLKIQVFPRRMRDRWIITCVLRNELDARSPNNKTDLVRGMLFQTFFEVRVQGGAAFSRYPDGVRPFAQLDEDEQTLALLYRDDATWAIGHGCAAGWECHTNAAPEAIFADIMPAVELPSMTPDINDQDGNAITLLMRELANLPRHDSGDCSEWKALDRLAEEYGRWISAMEEKIADLEEDMHAAACRHLDGCRRCLDRVRQGIDILKEDDKALEAFRLANQAMMLQQIASKQIVHRPLVRHGNFVAAGSPPEGQPRSPWEVWESASEKGHIGKWRAFQAAFLLMSITGLVDESCEDREIVDLIWFPTGGGKTEAYLAVAAFYMFYQRMIARPDDELRRDGTNVFMRYTLRMLTTQQFQRAASLVCAMDQIRMRRHPDSPPLGESRFTLGLWIGGDGSPNTWQEARKKIFKYEQGKISGNPLVLTECPWCRSAIGRLGNGGNGNRGRGRSNNLAGLVVSRNQAYLKCSDIHCEYGGEHDRLPVEVIDEAIYKEPPSLFIGTADKFAMMAWKPESGALFGFRRNGGGNVERVHQPPGLIIQDELHLISGPLGTIYGLYEGVIENLCTAERGYHIVRPKIVASTATIRGAADQVKAIYARDNLQLFPSPGLKMGDSFFGRYARTSDNRLAEGRLYLGIHAAGYRSFLTTKVRAFSAALFRASLFDQDKRDAWWTLLVFYNSLRELGSAQTLFQSDIASRMKDYARRYGLDGKEQRYLNTIEELTSRQSQAQLVELMDRLSLNWDDRKSIDACLASNIIEVGVDIDRLALMAVVGQPKSTAQYIQVTGRVGRRWKDRPGLILSMFNPSKSRDRSHFEQFHSYHRRLYERVEPTSATPFSVEAVERALAGVLILWARQFHDAPSPGGAFGDYQGHLETALELLLERCESIMEGQEQEMDRVHSAMHKVYDDLCRKWKGNPQEWWGFPQKEGAEYLMLWPGQFATLGQKARGVRALSSMRNVDGVARAVISDNYSLLNNERAGNGQ